jgi:dipeptidyl aminopeptidase/acylaminoacyl peptidase
MVSLPDPDGWIVGGMFSLSADGEKVAFIAGDADHYFEVYVSPTDRFAPRRVTDLGAQLDDFTLSSREVIQWPSHDGTEIEGILVKPPDFAAGRRYPLLVVIHGGPAAVSSPRCLGYEDTHLYPIELWAAKGALILMPNCRGSGGYGEAFRALNVRNLRVGDCWDVESGVEFLVDQGFVDKHRVGAMGWSQGGYIAAFITTFSDRFHAVSVGAGVSDWVTYYVNTDVHPFTRHYLQATPWEDMEIYQRTSPTSYINNAHTPTLIQHGEKDQCVPIAKAFELYQGLQNKGVPCRLIIYKGFEHSFDKPKASRALMEHNLAWFNHWLWGEELADDWPGTFHTDS